MSLKTGASGSDVVLTLRQKLWGLRDDSTGAWTGTLSSSALSTSLALVALLGKQPAEHTSASAGWLQRHQNVDGGWGDTSASPSNLSTTLITRAALCAVQRKEGTRVYQPAIQRATEWLVSRTGGMAFPRLSAALRDVYGQDRTFAIPILTFLAICEDDQEVWPTIPSLPFLLALLPAAVYRFFKLQIVSYALPALIAIGLCRHVCAAASRQSMAWGTLFKKPLMKKLEALQPPHGGFLDAIPLTAFVALALAQIGEADHPVACRATAFLRASYRPDGSYAIDTNLRIWVTSLATRALLKTREATPDFAREDQEKLARWILAQQQQGVHPYTGAQPGGWAWTDCAGGVPDADDTCAALIALYHLREAGVSIEMTDAVRAGLRWLLKLQNRDGGMPTFCKGWGRLPFDQSCPDIAAHALLACVLWHEQLRMDARVLRRLVAYLKEAQHQDGSWLPLWFGNQEAPEGRNPVIGTARVVDALRQAVQKGYDVHGLSAMLATGTDWLLHHQQADGGWGAGRQGSCEETALAVIALRGLDSHVAQAAVSRGCAWLLQQGAEPIPAPIGLYFSLLWYHENMYPLIWMVEALSGTSSYE